MRTCAEWDHTQGRLRRDRPRQPRGRRPRGEFAYSLCCTDVASGWTEVRTVRNRAEGRPRGARRRARCLPFPLLGLDSDNGGEFINADLLTWCDEQHLTFTRSRRLREERLLLRRAEELERGAPRDRLRALRHEAERELLAIYADLRLYVNFFLPTVKLRKAAHGARVRKRYDSRDAARAPAGPQGARRGRAGASKRVPRRSTRRPCAGA